MNFDYEWAKDALRTWKEDKLSELVTAGIDIERITFNVSMNRHQICVDGIVIAEWSFKTIVPDDITDEPIVHWYRMW